MTLYWCFFCSSVKSVGIRYQVPLLTGWIFIGLVQEFPWICNVPSISFLYFFICLLIFPLYVLACVCVFPVRLASSFHDPHDFLTTILTDLAVKCWNIVGPVMPHLIIARGVVWDGKSDLHVVGFAFLTSNITFIDCFCLYHVVFFPPYLMPPKP